MRNPDSVVNHEPSEPLGLLKHYMKDLVYGANDGVITTFAIVAGVTGAQLPARVVLILGMANLLADGFSMGASNFLAIRADEAVRRSDGHGILEPFPVRHGLVTFAAFVVAGSVPLLSYVIDVGDSAFKVAVVLTVLSLVGVGVTRASVTDEPWWQSALEVVGVGVAAAAVSFGVGALVAPFTA